jgi:hypothetical protein
MPLAQVLALKVGDQLSLSSPRGAPVAACGAATCRCSRRSSDEENRLAVRIERELAREGLAGVPDVTFEW